MPIIDLPDGTEIEFPDTMSGDEINAAVRKHLGHGPAVPSVKAPPTMEAVARGGLQGLTFGWGDEGSAAIAALIPGLDPEAAKGDTFSERYKNAREFYRNLNKKAEQAHPTAYTASEVGGSVIPAVAIKASAGHPLATAITQGAAQGAGLSEANDATKLLGDTALGAALGATGYGTGKILGKGLAAISRKAGEKVGLASARAGSQAAQEVAEGLASARGELGAEVQKGSRFIENLMRLEESMTSEQKALYRQLQEKGIVPNLQQAVAQSTLERLPAQTEAIAAKKAALTAAMEAAPATLEQRAAELAKPQFGADLKSLFKAYGEPAMAASIGGAVAGAPGAAVAGLMAGRTRMGKAIATRLNRPGNQMALYGALERLAQASQNRQLPQVLTRALAAGAAPAVVGMNEEGD